MRTANPVYEAKQLRNLAMLLNRLAEHVERGEFEQRGGNISWESQRVGMEISTCDLDEVPYRTTIRINADATFDEITR